MAIISTRTAVSVLKVSAPHVLIVLFCTAYCVFGACIFQFLELPNVVDENDTMISTNESSRFLSSESGFGNFQTSVLFSFIAISTIGWGNVAPSTFGGRLFCIFYSAVGIPIVLLAVADLGKFITRGCWRVMRVISYRFGHLTGKQKTLKTKTDPDMDKPLPVIVILFLLFFHVVAGGFLFRIWEANQNLGFFDATYFSFVSFTTIGFGDIYPKNLQLTIPVIIYLFLGMAIMSTFVTTFNKYLQKIHYLGRKVQGAGQVDVWFGAQSFSVEELLRMIGVQLDISPYQLQQVLRRLDSLIEEADSDRISAFDSQTVPEDSVNSGIWDYSWKAAHSPETITGKTGSFANAVNLLHSLNIYSVDASLTENHSPV